MTCTYSKEFSASAFTDIENAFITEYMPISSGNAVKVYLYGLFVCQNSTKESTLKDFSESLKLSEEEIKDCFTYWEEFGLVNVLSKEPLMVEYLPVRTAYTTKPRKYKAEKYTDFTKGLQVMLPSRMISTNEYSEYFHIMDNYSIKPEAMLLIVKYCVDKKGSDIGYRYISKVARDFGERGINTCEKVEKELSTYILRTAELSKILSALSLKRQPEIEDLTLLKKWTKELNFEIDNIVFAASKLKKGSMNKLDEFIMELYAMKSFSKEEINAYMDEKRKVYDLAIKINKALSLYMDVIDTVVDNYTKKWLSYGYDEKSLLFIANYCFKQNKNSLQAMDELIEQLRQKGVIDLTSVNDYFEQENINTEFLGKMLRLAGVTRRPTPWDKDNLNMWKSWNFSEEMILQAAMLSAGKLSPIQYMNGILSNWKNNSIYTVESIQNNNQTAIASQEEYNREYALRRDKALTKAQKNIDKALEIEGFAQVYSRLNELERELAFATVNDNREELFALAEEKRRLNAKAQQLLKTINLDFSDLSPKYACDKCNDTGYIGTKRCDCYDKFKAN